jgi:hypothetical protein
MLRGGLAKGVPVPASSSDHGALSWTTGLANCSLDTEARMRSSLDRTVVMALTALGGCELVDETAGAIAVALAPADPVTGERTLNLLERVVDAGFRDTVYMRADPISPRSAARHGSARS